MRRLCFRDDGLGFNRMIPILPIIDPLARLATAALEHVNLRKSALGSKEKQDQTRRLNELEDSDLEQGQLLSELSENVEQLAKAVESQVEADRVRHARITRLLYAAIFLAILSLAVSLMTFPR